MKNYTNIVLVFITVLLAACSISDFEWTLPKFAVVETSEPVNILDVSAKSGGNISDDGGSPVQERGVCFSIKINPTIADSVATSGNGTGSFDATLSGLKGSTTYYLRAYATTKAGTAYGSEFTFTTLNFATVVTQPVNSITLTTAVFGGNISNNGGADVTERGICFGTSKNPSITETTVKEGSGLGEYSVNLTDLTPGTTYYVRAYAINIIGIVYGNEVVFTTASLPTLTTVDANQITQTSAKSGGVISNAGSSTVMLRGICFDTNNNPTISNNIITSGSGPGSFTSSIAGLNPGTTFYVRAFATNSAGTAYGNEITFTTNPVLLPTLSTTVASSITRISAISGGNVTNDGGGAVTSKGICFNTTHDPTIEQNIVEKGAGKGSFTADMTGLTPGTTYYVRAYATNSAGTAYGSEITFSTNPILVPTISTSSASSITRISAVSGGNVTNDGGDAVTSRGICFNTTHDPTIEQNIVEKGAGKGSFITEITGLTPKTTYYVRAFATNSAGTAYGNEITFTTNPILLPSISTTSVLSITRISATSGGNVTNDGGDAVSARGICYSTTVKPTIEQNIVEKGAGNGIFSADMTGLIPGTTYHIRAFATNSAGTSYGSEITFTTVAPFKIGQSYQGGIIFYVDDTYLHGLISTTFDQSVGATWGCSGTTILKSNGMAIGTGLSNTTAIMAECSATIGTAARLCNDLVLNGYNDWCLPSHDELDLMYKALKLQGLGGFSNVSYWSSTQYSATNSYSQSFSNGTISQSAKSSTNRVRAIRSF